MNIAITASFLAAALSADLRNDPFFKITVVDEATERGVPLIELRTVNDLVYYTDSAGVVAFQEPGLMDQVVYFQFSGHGYELPPDGFGFHGRKLTTSRGGGAVVKVRRINVAERLYRVTGAGIYCESTRVGIPSPIREPVLNAAVLGSDSVQTAVLNGRIYWFWGDTNRPSYPLGNFHAPGATSRLPSAGGLDPNTGVDLEYFVDADGVAKSTCKMPGEGPTWIDGLAVVADEAGKERLFAHYMKIKPPLTIYQQGMAAFNEQKQEFEQRMVFPDDAVVIPSGHSFTVSENGQKYIYFAKPFPIVRVPAKADAIIDPKQYEAFTCCKQDGGRDEVSLDRDDQRILRYGWKQNTTPLTADWQKKLIDAGKLSPDECPERVRDIETNKPLTLHHGSVSWNAYRKRWLLIASQIYGSSMLGEAWYAESDSPQGPWGFARKIVTHDKQSFYNPKQHPFFEQLEGRRVFFEGTYTHSFSGNNARTPRYEYNQMMYRLDLDDARLNLPVAVYRQEAVRGERLATRDPAAADGTIRRVAFFAWERPFDRSVPVFGVSDESGTTLSVKNESSRQSQPLFYALPPDTESIPSGCVGLFELANPRGKSRYFAGEKTEPGTQRDSRPICYVWSVRE